MKEYYASGPLLWVKSSVWFGFAAERLRGILSAQRWFHSDQPPNYGIITGVLMAMMRLIIHNPIISEHFVREALCDLEMSTTISRFGIFFIPVNWNERLIEKLEKADGRDVRLAYDVGRATKQRKATRFIGPLPSPDQYPLGSTPSWGTLSESIRRDPSVIMSEFHFDRTYAVNFWASELLVAMTRQVIMYLDTERSGLLDSTPVLPETLEQAMNCWTPSYLRKIFLEVAWIPSSAGLRGAGVPGRRTKDFASIFRHFFPRPFLPGQRLPSTSPWYPFLSGYLESYYKHLTMWGEESQLVREMEDALRSMFENLQCLPNHTPGKHKTPGKLWMQDKHGVVEILTNSNYYRVLEIAAQPRARQNVMRLKLSKPIFVRALRREMTVLPQSTILNETKKAAAVNKKRSKASRNFRVPREYRTYLSSSI